MANRNGNPLIDAQTTLVGWTNRSATRPEPHTYLSGEEVQLFLAPVLRDGSRGHWIPALTVALPKEGGPVEAFLRGHDIALDPADVASVLLPAVPLWTLMPNTPNSMCWSLVPATARAASAPWCSR
jgi:hypothetical protein